MPQNNREKREVADQKMLDGLKKNAQALTFLMVAGKPVTPADVVTALQARLDSSHLVASTKLVWQGAVKADQDERAKSDPLIKGVRQSLQSAFGDSADVLGEYGLKPRKSTIVSPSTKVAAAAKAKATRAARHTMGSNQKAQIKGTVEVPVTSLSPSIPPSPAAASPAPVAAPAAAPVAVTAPKPLG